MNISRQKKAFAIFYQMIIVVEKGAERGAHPYAQSEYTWFLIIFFDFESMSTLQLSYAHPFPPPFFTMNKLWKYEAWGIIGM